MSMGLYPGGLPSGINFALETEWPYIQMVFYGITTLLNIFVSNVFLVMNNVNFVSYADNVTIYSFAEIIDNAIMSLQESAKITSVVLGKQNEIKH